ncbi:MAG: site-specific integrase [Candidatus Marinimicrobia bacterium]|nr:site-specific integrase [Candidatus Neomarinimicrobiota bacterium]
MATLLRLPGGTKNRGNKNRAGKFYGRVSIPRPGQRPKQKLVPLKTENHREAALRLQEVEKVEALIKEGVEYDFPWMEGHRTAVKQISVEQAAKDYLSIRANEGLSDNTLEIFYNASNHLMKIVGALKPLENIIADDIQDYIRTLRKSLEPTSLNMYLRNLRTFFRWANESGILSHPPKIKEVAQLKRLPSYISNNEFNLIQDAASPFYADIFWFYRATGCRLQEPFNAELKGSYLIVPTENSKGREERQIPLTPELIQIYEELIAAGHRPEYYSKEFKRLCRLVELEDHKFHHLRHTFAVRTWLQTGDIYLVCQLMGHKSIQTTMIYTKFYLSRLQEDFPDLAGFAENKTLGRADIIGSGTGLIEERTHPPYTDKGIRKDRPSHN